MSLLFFPRYAANALIWSCMVLNLVVSSHFSTLELCSSALRARLRQWMNKARNYYGDESEI